jgi:serine/threonine-protein kinase RsbW
VQPSPDGETFVVDAKIADIRLLAEHLQMHCVRAGVEPGAAFELELAMVEAANNVVEHGYAEPSGGTIGLAVVISECEARVTLRDSGAPVPDGFFDDGTMPDPLATSGRGSGIILACVDTVSYRSQFGENTLVLTKRLGSSRA